MLKNISKIPFNYLGRCLNLPLVLPMSVAFAVTYKCNSHCKTCNIWRDSSEVDELNLSEINYLFRSLGKSFAWITLSGGEPFLRSDLADICQIIYQNCHPIFINIPTNGSLPDRIIYSAKKILKNCPKTKLTINLSVDGVGEKHDNIRGLPGNFDKIIATYQGLKNLKTKQLRLGLYTIISDYNIDDWENIFSFSRKLLPDSHFFEIAQTRDEFKNQELNQIIPPKERCLIFLKRLHNIEDMDRKSFLGNVIHTLRINYYSLVKKTIFLEQQVIPCFAAFASAYILPDGKVWACSSQNFLMGDLREYEFNFKRLWRSKIAQDIRRNIKNRKCFCTQVKINYINFIHSPAYLGKLIYRYLF